MHIPSKYITSAIPGDLSLPPLSQHPGRPRDLRFSENVNKSGVYIHKLCIHGDAIKEQFDKIECNKIPTPGTFVGIGMHRTYNMDRWARTSGIIFSPDTPSMISYKGDIASVRLSNINRNFSHFSSKSGKTRHERYAQYLSTKFNALGKTGTAFNNRKPKQLRLVEDVNFAKNKYRELELRSNLAFASETPVSSEFLIYPDESSKYSIVKLLQSSGIAIDSLTKSSLLDILTKISQEETDIGQRLRHAIKKLERFDDDAAIQTYLNQGKEAPVKRNHYSDIVREWGAQTPNEHLLMPTIANIAGVCVNVEATRGIDQALKINTVLNEKQTSAGVTCNNNPAFVYHLSPKSGKSLVHIGWSQCVSPWSSKGLIEFAKTGKVTGIDGIAFKPNHFKLINALADASALVFFENEKTLLGCKFTKNFLDDLSPIKENNENLLHIAIANNRDVDTIMFLYFWQVNAFTEKNAENLTAYELAKKENHPCYSFLEKVKSWENKNEIISLNRNTYIKERLDRIPKALAHYVLRDGSQEHGEITYVHEQGTYRVTKGYGNIGKENTITWKGVKKYCPAALDLGLSIGSIDSGKELHSHSGIFDLEKKGLSNGDLPLIFYQYRPLRKPKANFPEKGEKISFASTLPGVDFIYEIALKNEPSRFVEADIEGSRRLSAKGDHYYPDSQCCTYFKAKLFLPKKLKKIIEDISNQKRFAHLPVDEKSFDRSLLDNDRHLLFCKYLLANIRYLSSWKKNIDKLSSIELEFLIEDSPKFVKKTDSLLDQQKNMLHQLLSRHYQTILVEEFEKVDVYGRCLLQEFAEEYLEYSHLENANMQCIFANRMEVLNGLSHDDLVIARKLYEQAAFHAHGEAEFALVRFHQNGMGGLPVNKTEALTLLRRASDHNVPEALVARRLLEGSRHRITSSMANLMLPKK